MSCRIGRPEAWGGCQMATGLCQGLRRLPWLLRSATAPGPRLSAPGGRPRREQAKVLAGQEPSNPEGGRSPAIPPFRRVNTHSHGGRASGRGRALRAPEGNRNPEPGTRSRTEGHTSENAMRDVRNRQTECQTEARTGQLTEWRPPLVSPIRPELRPTHCARKCWSGGFTLCSTHPSTAL